ncbi:MAG: cytochrome b/b6 domain-containing protein [Geminicoccaceae bacterium]
MDTPRDESVYVWDLPTRLFHWALVGLIAAAWLSAEFGSQSKVWHMRIGYAVITLVVFRVIWGFVGGRHARFAAFLPTPGRLLRYLRTILSRTNAATVGHNPLGALSVIALLAIVLGQALTGLFADDEIFTTGPFAGLVASDWRKTLTGWHHQLFDILLVLIVLHLASIAFYRLWKRNDLVRPMITGRKPATAVAPGEHDNPVPARGRVWLAAVVLAICALGMWGALELFTPPPGDDYF